MPALLSSSKSKTEARKYRDRNGTPRPPKYWAEIEEVHPTTPVDLCLLLDRLEKDPKLWFVLADSGRPNDEGQYRRSLKPLAKSKTDEALDPAGLTTPTNPEILVFDFDSGRWPAGCDESTPPPLVAAELSEQLAQALGRPKCSAVVAFSGNHIFKGCRAKVFILPDRMITWAQAAGYYARANTDAALANPAQPIFVAPPMLPEDTPDPMPDGRVFYIPADADKLDCSPRPGDLAKRTWAALHKARKSLEELEEGAPRHPAVNRCAFQCAGVAAGEKAPESLVVDFLLELCSELPQYSDRDFEDEIKRGAADGYAQPITPIDGELVTSKDGDIKPTLSNAAILLSQRVQFVENDFGDHELIRPPPWDLSGEYPQKVEEYQLRCATAWLQSNFRTAFRKADVSDAIGMLAATKHVDRLKEYLDRVSKLPRGRLTLDNAAAEGWGATDTTSHRLAIRRFLLQCVARADDPGTTGELVLVLKAPPGKGKGRSAWQLFTRPGARYFTSSHISIGKQSQYAPILRGLWGAELGEQRSVSAWHQDVFKAFLSQRKIVYRAPYERRAGELLLRVNYVWTTEHETPLNDENWRRFLVLEVGQWQEWSGEEIDKLWGDAVRAYRDGERAWLDAEDENILKPARELAYDVDSLEAHVEAILHTPELRDDSRAIDTVIRVLAMRSHFGVKVADTTIRHRVGKIMKRLGWENRPTWSAGKTARSYFPPDDWEFNNMDGNATDVTTTY